ncbi:MAG: SIMPL domain-containing protein [Planctomycetaceae bacterium]|nr:SIMPL domain-containing protein [Planctomycetaceae bacterium]
MFRLPRPWPVCALLIFFAPSIATAADRLVSVSGSGRVSAPPDEVVIKIQFSTVDDDLVRVRADSDKQLKAILDLAQKQGAKPGDYDVSSLKLELSFNEQLKRQVYEVQRELSVKLGVLANLNPLLADLLKLSDIRIGSITFGSSKSRDYEMEARRRAVADAKETAAHLAMLAELKLGKARQISAFNQAIRPFVTSVIPVVGQADPFAPRRASAARPRSSSQAAAAVEGPGGVEFVVAQAGGGQVAGNAANDEAFGLGLIEFTADVSIEFELVE